MGQYLEDLPRRPHGLLIPRGPGPATTFLLLRPRPSFSLPIGLLCAHVQETALPPERNGLGGVKLSAKPRISSIDI
jgi:hypothetical protein